MTRKKKGNMLLVILLIGLTIIITIFAIGKTESSPQTISTEKYEENIRCLNDTIKTLKEDISRYKVEIERIAIERENIRKALDAIIKHNEKVDSNLANGGWDTNIEFLTDYLSKDDSGGE